MRILVCVVVSALAAGCQTQKVALNDTVTPLQGKTVAVARHQDSDFYQKTTGSMLMGGALGWAMEASGGNAMAKQAQLADPAYGIADTLTQALVAKYGMQRLETKGVTKATRPDSLVAENPGADYIVDVKTINWALMPASFSQYNLVYVAELKLIQATTKLPVAKATCQSGQVDPVKAPTKEEFLANEGALLKQYTAQAAARCVDEWSQQLLMLGAVPNAIAQPVAAPPAAAAPNKAPILSPPASPPA